MSRILIVDDEKSIRLPLRAFLLADGHEVEIAEDADQAQALLSTGAWDVVVSDIVLPGISGVELLKTIRAAAPDVQVIMMTGEPTAETAAEAVRAGASDYLVKPVDKRAILHAVDHALKVKTLDDHMRHYQEELEAEVARKTEDLRAALRKIEAVTLDTIYRLSRAAECKDDNTGAHVQRVGHYAAAMARRTGQSDAFVDMLMYAAPMHDIGKIGIPDRILLKASRLDADEWRIMKTHTEIGATILGGSDSDILRMAESVALAHHEKWDGSGYPRGLKGTAIPLPGRLTAIADVFDALCSRRPYKEPVPVDQALYIIRKRREQHFDPEIVDAFLSSQADIVAIQARFVDDAIGNSLSPSRQD